MLKVLLPYLPYKGNKLHPAFDIGLDINPVSMVLYCLQADKKFLRNFLVAQTIAYFTDYFRFARRYFKPPAELLKRDVLSRFRHK